MGCPESPERLTIFSRLAKRATPREEAKGDRMRRGRHPETPTSMHGTMMNYPLVLPAFLERAGTLFRDVEMVSRRPDRTIVRSTLGDFYLRACRLAEALTILGIQRGDRVATMMWNHSGHLEAFFGVPCSGAILHTLNLRLHPHEIACIVNKAQDRFLIVDDVAFPLFEKFRDQVHFEKIIVVPYGCGNVPSGFLNYDELLASASGKFEYPKLDENDGAGMCFTSGTTGSAKGVVYTHRSLVLHSMAEAMVDSMALSHHDTILPIAPMFHANAWGVPFTAVMVGAKVVFPGPALDSESILDLMISEKVTVANAVPTIWIGVLDAMEKNPGRWKFPKPVRVVSGGSAPPASLMRRLDELGIHILHFWGMTETSPLATTGHLKSRMLDWSEEKKYAVRAKQGWPSPLIDIRITHSEEDPTPLPWDGESAGELEIRGPWVAGKYYEMPEHNDRWTADGWFRTGDVATIDEDGIVKLVDRTKDLVKSGGEWISSVDLENNLMAHPAVKEACVVGLPHPKWQERPLAAVVLKDGAAATPAELREFLAVTFAKWQLPDAIVFVDAIPRTSVGKFKKTELRERFAGWNWE
jgi:fatty-acyl-CoA synthase